MPQSQLDVFTSLDVAASIDNVIVSADPEIRRGSVSAFQVRDASGAAGAFRYVIDTVNKRMGFSGIGGTFAPGVTWDSEVQGGDFFMRSTVYSSGLDDETEWVARKAHGTKAAPLALGLGSCILEWEVNGYDGAGFTAERGSMTIRTSQAWAVGANGIEIAFRVTLNGTAASYDALLIQNDGDLDITVGGLEIGNVQVFESDRDLAVSLIPNADIALTLGSSSRRFTQAVANQFDVFGAVGDAQPTTRVDGGAVKLGPGGAGALDARMRRGLASNIIFDNNGVNRTIIIDAAARRLGYTTIDDAFVPLFDWHSEKQSSEFEVVFDHYGTGNFHMVGRHANGTKAAPTTLADDDDMMEISGVGYDGVAFSGDQATLLLEADGAWTAVSHGTKWTVKTTTPGSTVIHDSLEVRGSGAVNVILAEFEIGGVDVFEADRDLAINLVPNADGVLNLGQFSALRRFNVALFKSTNYQKYEFFGDQFENPVNADWVVNALAPASADTINAARTVRRFDDTVEEGVGFSITIPANATEIRVTFRHRAQTAPGAPVTTQPRLYRRTRADNAAWGAWSAAFAFTALSIPASTAWQDDVETVTLSTLGLTVGQVAQFELTRDPADGLTGDWVLDELMVEVL